MWNSVVSRILVLQVSKRLFWHKSTKFSLICSKTKNPANLPDLCRQKLDNSHTSLRGVFSALSTYSDEQEQSNLIVHLWDCEVLKCKSCGSKSPIFACLGKRLLPKGMCFYMYSITADLWNIKKYSERIKHQRHICYLSNLIAYLWGTAWVFNIFSGAGVNFELPKSL